MSLSRVCQGLNVHRLIGGVFEGFNLHSLPLAPASADQSLLSAFPKLGFRNGRRAIGTFMVPNQLIEG